MNIRRHRALLALASLVAVCGTAQAQAPFGIAPAAPKASPQSSAPGASGAARAPNLGGALYIAGDSFSLDQAVDDGVRENAGRSSFAVLALNTEISKLGIHGATSEVTAVILKAGKNGGTLYVCERDVKRQGFAAHEFLPGVQVVRGFSKAEAQSAGAAAKGGGAPLAPLQRMRSICAE